MFFCCLRLSIAYPSLISVYLVSTLGSMNVNLTVCLAWHCKCEVHFVFENGRLPQNLPAYVRPTRMGTSLLLRSLARPGAPPFATDHFQLDFLFVTRGLSRVSSYTFVLGVTWSGILSPAIDCFQLWAALLLQFSVKPESFVPALRISTTGMRLSLKSVCHLVTPPFVCG